MTDDKTQKVSAMWGGRFDEGPTEAMLRFNTSIEEDKRLAMEDIDGSIAHASMLGETGILSDKETATLVDGLNQIRTEIKTGAFQWSLALEDVHMNVESRLREIVGEVAGKLHTGRSRNDQVATDFRLYTRRALDELDHILLRVQRAFLKQADGHEKTVMPGFTHLQIAQPISYGFYCLAYVEMFSRDRDRLRDARARLNESPLGAAALAGTPHPINRQTTAKALEFSRPCRNALDAVSARDFALEVTAALSICATHISRYAEEVVIYATPQFGYLKVSDAYSTGSSIMPQKRNPDAAELLRAKAGSVTGAYAALALTCKGLPLAYSKDLQDTKKPVIEALDTMGMALDILAKMVETTTPDPEAMGRDAGKGFATATDLADMLAMDGVAFRDAHHIVGALVAHAEERGITLAEIQIADAQKISPKITQSMLDRLTPTASLTAKRSEGSTHPDDVIAQIAWWHAHLE